MDASYPTRYRDAKGEVATVVHDDGETLSMCIRGVEFQGMSLDDFEPIAGTDPTAPPLR